MSASARLTVRLMDPTRRIDEFEMKTLENDAAIIILAASSAAIALAARTPGCPDERQIAYAAIERAHQQVFEDGFSVRTQLLEGGWLLLVRIDKRTGPAIRHDAASVTPLRLAA